MHQILLGHLVEQISPAWLHLLTEEERTKDIVLRHGVDQVNEDDVKEIMEAVISEKADNTLYH
ncbi:hypothetical protein ACFO4L_13370 [Bacillus daqingensis]|uniref:Uncharacterized protein n=1 Tax=Bacillus daqingensis TaxID=872396 RepID=A0ABV9NZQ2_9BACI